MITTKETTLEWLNSQVLGFESVSDEATLRWKVDSFFMKRGFEPRNFSHSDNFQNYWNVKKASSLKVNEVDHYNDELLGNDSWVIIKGFGHLYATYIAPYNALQDVGVTWEYRGHYFTSKENSKKEDLLHALQILIQNNLAYEL
jgi:hypothetical protein|tara:strand:- start:573 stop:1004 length:432 start_codon:yes stop_codon:yes gene_type:complete